METPSLQPTPTAEASLNPSVEPFPDPISGQAVYDEAGVLSTSVEASLETQIDDIAARSGAELVVYLRVDPDATEDSNLAAARALMDRWALAEQGSTTAW